MMTGQNPDSSRVCVFRVRSVSGTTLVEVAVASVVLVVTALGALRYQYYAVTQGQIARAQIAATHTASLLLMDWKSTGGSVDYDPSGLGLGFSAPQAIPAGFQTAQGLGSVLNDAVYTLRQDDTTVMVMLKYRDVNQDVQAGATLRQLAVVVRFSTPQEQEDRAGRLAGLPSTTFVTYVRVDVTNG